MKGWLSIGGLALVMILCVPERSRAQWLRLGEWEGSFESGAEYAHQDTKTADSRSLRLQSISSENRLNLRNAGSYILVPRLVTFSVGGTIGFSHNWLTTDSERESREGLLLGYDFFSTILSEGALSFNLFANRNQTTLSGGLPGTTDLLAENRGATVFARRLYIPSTLAFRQEFHDQESRSRDLVSRRTDRRNVLTYEGQRGWIDSEMGLRYEFVDLSDEVFPNLSYQSHEGSLYYSLDFGPELNRRWDSRLRYFIRSGQTDLRTLNVNELLRVDHTPRLQTNYRYSLIRIETSGGTTMNNSVGFNARHRLYENLTTDLKLGGSIQSLPGGERDRVRSRLDFAYTKRIPWNGRLNIGLGGGVQYDANRFRSTESFVPQETHAAATPFALPIQLANPFVIAGSVVVTKIALGPLPPGCLAPPGPPVPLVLGQDYTLQTTGDFTEIVPIPCSGIIAGINPGDTIAVDYRFSISPSLTFLTIPWHFNISANYRWIRPYFMHEQTEQTLLSGRDGRFLDSQRLDTVGTELRSEGQRLRASLLGEFRNFDSHRIAYNAVRLNQFLAYTIVPDLTLTVTGDEAFYSFSRPARETRTLATRATLTYVLGATLSADAFAGIRALSDSSAPSERIAETGLGVRWYYRKVEVLPSFQFSDRRRGDTDTRDFRLTLRVVRRF